MVAAERGPVEGVIPALTGFAGFWPRDAKGWRADVPHFVTPGLTRGPAFLLGPRPAQGSGTPDQVRGDGKRSEEHTSELQSLMRISYAVFCLKINITPGIGSRNAPRPTIKPASSSR